MVETVAVENYRVKTFTIRLSDRRQFRPGQHFDVRLTAPDGYQAQRSYSIGSAPESEGVIDLTVELIPDGEVIATRVLAHPHDNEQPFTRSLGGVRIPAGLAKVRVRAHDKVHGYGGNEIDVDMKTGQAGPGGGSS